jgi:hypothetical protein
MADEVSIKLYKNRWAGNVLADDCVHSAYRNVIYKYKNY